MNSILNIRRLGSPKLVSLALLGAGLACASFAQVDSSLFSGLKWRNIGPFRGGRVAAVSGVVGVPGTFYMGMPLGGVWKTTSAGQTWFPIMDSVKSASSVGSVEVAPSDPNIIYVGMGDMVTGGGINEGDGLYKSTDAGKTWVHLGFENAKQIPSILVDPHDPNLVMMAVQGNIHEQSEMRGVYRSTDGGKTWTKTLYVNNQTGVQKIAWAYDHPEIMLATTVRHYNAPGAARGGRAAVEAAERPEAAPHFTSRPMKERLGKLSKRATTMVTCQTLPAEHALRLPTATTLIDCLW